MSSAPAQTLSPENVPGVPPPQFRIMVGTPAYGGQCFVQYTLSLINSLRHLSAHNVFVEPCFLSNESLIPRGRNTVCAKFLNDPTLTHLLFIDADINWAPGTIWRLLQHDKDIVGALYPKKGYDWAKLLKNPECMRIMQQAQAEQRDLNEREQALLRAKLVSFVVNLDGEHTSVSNGLMRVKHLGTGFMLIKRSVLEHMAREMPELKYDDDINVLTGTENDWLYAFFNTEVHRLTAKRHFLSEDYLFCMRAQQLGYQIWADITIPLTHTGTHSFPGNFAICHNLVRSPPTVVTASESAGPPTTTAAAAQSPGDSQSDDKLRIERVPPNPPQLASLEHAQDAVPSDQPIESRPAAAPPGTARLAPADIAKLRVV